MQAFTAKYVVVLSVWRGFVDVLCQVKEVPFYF